MYDFWYTLGVAIIKPTLLDAIQAANPVFDFVDRLIVETRQGIPTTLLSAPYTGVLEHQPTTDVRSAIGKFVHEFNAAAPPIGIYCAGRFSQMVKIPFFDGNNQNSSSFKDIITLANTAYTKALAGGAESALPTFPAFIGLMLLDGTVAAGFGAPTPELLQILSEFRIVVGNGSREWRIATALAQTPEFQDAGNVLMVQDFSPWRVSTLEQIFFWDGKSEHAIP